jgi:hypothetical protein
MCYKKQAMPRAISSVLLICLLCAWVMKSVADEVLPQAWGEFQQALKPISPESITNLRKTAGNDYQQLMGAAILAQGKLSRDIQRECVDRFPETEKYFLGHELNQLQMEEKDLDRIRTMAGRLTVIDPDNALGHCYLAALAARRKELEVLNQRLSIMMECQKYTPYIDEYLTAHFSALENLNLPFYPVRKVYVIKGLNVGHLLPNGIIRNHLVGEADKLAEGGDSDAAEAKYREALVVAGHPLTARPRLILVEQYHNRSVSRILTRMAEMWDQKGQTVRAEICRHNAHAHDRHYSWTRELTVRKSVLHRLSDCTHLNPLDLGYLDSFAEQLRLQGELRANELAPDKSWLSVPPHHMPDEWNWQTGKPKE